MEPVAEWPNCGCERCETVRAAMRRHRAKASTRERVAGANVIADGPELFADLPERVDVNRRLAYGGTVTNEIGASVRDPRIFCMPREAAT